MELFLGAWEQSVVSQWNQDLFAVRTRPDYFSEPQFAYQEKVVTSRQVFVESLLVSGITVSTKRLTR